MALNADVSADNKMKDHQVLSLMAFFLMISSIDYYIMIKNDAERQEEYYG